MAKTELILKLGIEGGGASIHRTPLASGGYQYHVEGSSMDLDENDDETWRQGTTEPVETLHAALSSIDKDGLWILFSPLLVHPDYRGVVWQQVQELARTLSGEHAVMWKRRSADWQRLCLDEA